MKNKDYNLSEKILQHGKIYDGIIMEHKHINVEDIKEFIKRLKEDFLVKEYKDFEELIDTLAGEELSG